MTGLEEALQLLDDFKLTMIVVFSAIMVWLALGD
jgi:hypothetical protein